MPYVDTELIVLVAAVALLVLAAGVLIGLLGYGLLSAATFGILPVFAVALVGGWV